MKNDPYAKPKLIVGKRQQLIRPSIARPSADPTEDAGSLGLEKTQKRSLIAAKDNSAAIKELQGHLQTAIELEHSTIPPYLFALYSIQDNANQEAAAIIRSVVMEEMLHMIMACNILNAIGGTPAINKPDFIPEYPTCLPHSDNAFVVNLERFSKPCLETFLAIEKPAQPMAPPEHDQYHSIGQFYDAIKDELIALNKSTNGSLFIKDHSRQITQEQYYGGGGKLVAVYNLDDALLAINEIIGQGEGIDNSLVDTDFKIFGEEIEYAHYFRFNEIYEERYYSVNDTPKSGPSGRPLHIAWDKVQPVKPNVKMNDFIKGSETWNLMYQFNKTYCSLLNALHNAVNGRKEELEKAVAIMFQLKYQAVGLMNIPMGNGENAGPSFEYVG